MTTLLRLAIHRMDFARAAEKRSLEAAVQDEALFQSLSLDDLSALFARRVRARSFVPEALLAHAEEDLRVLEDRGIQLLFHDHAAVPRLLREIYDPPFALFVVGSLPDGPPPVAVVGTRSPSAAGAAAAERLGRELGAAGVSVVSGLARGIDTRAHRGALEAGGRHVIVLGSGIDTIYPPENRGLARRVLEEQGAVLSEYPPGVPPTKYHFPERNRIISGLSRGVVLVEAPAQSGALFTADFALEEGRELMVHAAGVDEAGAAGTALLAREGAPVVRGAEDVLGQLGLPAAAGRERPRKRKWPRAVPAVQSRAAGRQLGLDLISEIEGENPEGEPRV